MYFSAARLLGERPGQHELGLEDGLRPLHDPVEGGRHPRNGRMPDPALNVPDRPSGVALVPGAVELLGGRPELDDEVAGQVLRLDIAPFLPPQADEGGFVVAHDDPGVRAADKGAAALVRLCPQYLEFMTPSAFGKWEYVVDCRILQAPVRLK